MRTKLGVTIVLLAFAGIGLVSNLAGGNTDRPENLLSLINVNASSEPDGAIRAVLTSQQAAWNRGDIRAFLDSGYRNSPELTFAGSDGIVRGYDGLLETYRKHYPDKEAMGELEFSGLEIRQLGSEAALVLGHWHLKRQSDDLGGVFSLVFQRFPEGWRIIHDHTSAQKQTQ
jgi:beta-aspartyl-peptidase (threonine type)